MKRISGLSTIAVFVAVALSYDVLFGAQPGAEVLSLQCAGIRELYDGNSAYLIVSRNGPNGEAIKTAFERTHRHMRKLIAQAGYAPFLFEDLAGKRVLDVGCGNFGFFVKELRENRLYDDDGYPTQLPGVGVVDATGIDIDPALAEEQRKDPHAFRREDAKNTSFQNGEFDVIFSSWSVFADKYRGDDAFPKEYLVEMKRILKRGGVMRFSPVNHELLRKAIRGVGGLEETARSLDGRHHWIEIRKID